MTPGDRSIVCHVDRSVDPSTTLGCARQLSQRLDRRLVVMASAPAFAPLPGLRAEPVAPTAWPHGPAVLYHAVRALGRGARADFRVVRGDARDALLDLAAEEAAEMIAVTSTGRGPLLAALLERPHATLTGDSHRPLLVVPEALRGPRDAAHVICGIDGSSESCAAARVAASIAGRLDVPLTLVHAAAKLGSTVPAGTGADHGSAVAAELAASTGVFDRALRELPPTTSPRQSLVYGDPVNALTRAAAASSAPLLVVGARGRGPLKAATLGSVSAKLVTQSERPVVIVPAGAARAADVDEHAAGAAA